MKRVKHLLTITIFVAGALLTVAGNVGAASYSARVDRFGVVGNLPGNIVDEFNDGSIAPLWEIYDPTVVESGGSVTFSNPGTTTPPFQIGSLGILSSEMSYIGSKMPGQLQMVNGAGDFQGASRWMPTIPGINQFYTMGISNDAAGEEISIGVYKFDSAVAGAFGIPQGLGVFFGRFGDVQLGDFDAQGVTITPAEITGDILLRLAFVDATNVYSGSFSLDGGKTFISPYSTFASGTGGQELGWSLGVESFTVPVPGGGWLFGTAVLTLWRVRRPNRATAR